MQIEHRGFNIGMAKQFFQGHDIQPIFEQMGRKRVPECMYTYLFLDISLLSGLFYSPLNAPL